MSGDTWFWTQVVLYGIGFTCGAGYMIMHRPSKWRTMESLALSGWVIPYTLLLGMLLFLVITNPVPPPDGQALRRGVAVVGLLTMDTCVVGLLWMYLKFWQEERVHPTKLCTRCRGKGVLRRDTEGGR